jgi:hypothetical protein
MMRVWIHREDAEAEKIAAAVREFIMDASEPSYREVDMSS